MDLAFVFLGFAMSERESTGPSKQLISELIQVFLEFRWLQVGGLVLSQKHHILTTNTHAYYDVRTISLNKPADVE